MFWCCSGLDMVDTAGLCGPTQEHIALGIQSDRDDLWSQRKGLCVGCARRGSG